jgi:hypothetical protein
MTEPSRDWKEIVPEGEAAELEALGEKLREIQRRRGRNGERHRALHAKGHLGLEATFEVRADLPAHAKHGLFAKPGKHRAIVRFSNGAGRHQHDGVGDVRGVAIKVLGVPGKKVVPGLEDATTQDFLLIQNASTPFRDPREFVALVVAISGNPLLALPRFAGAVGIGRALGLLPKAAAGVRSPFATFAGKRMFSALPIRVGPYAARYAILPIGEAAPPSAPKLPLADDLGQRLRQGPLAWDFALQFFVDEAKTPIEDASVEWKESDSPFVPVARFELPRQDPASERGRRLSERVEGLSFDPWHALVEHRPLGAMMRARNHAYRLSTEERGAAPEPDESCLS